MSIPNVNEYKGTCYGVFSLEICKRAKWVNGVGYAAVEEDVGAFAMCYNGLYNVMKVSYKECPQGQNWNEEDVTCVRFTRVETFQGTYTMSINKRYSVVYILRENVKLYV